jgi:hypothetical protein
LIETNWKSVATHGRKVTGGRILPKWIVTKQIAQMEPEPSSSGHGLMVKVRNAHRLKRLLCVPKTFLQNTQKETNKNALHDVNRKLAPLIPNSSNDGETVCYYYYYYYYYLLQLGFHPVAVVLTLVHTIQMDI